MKKVLILLWLVGTCNAVLANDLREKNGCLRKSCGVVLGAAAIAGAGYACSYTCSHYVCNSNNCFEICDRSLAVGLYTAVLGIVIAAPLLPERHVPQPHERME